MQHLTTEEQATLLAEEQTNTTAPLSHPDKDILYAYLFAGKITMEEYLFLSKKTIEGNIG